MKKIGIFKGASLQKTIVAQALTLAFGIGLAGGVLVTSAYAQSNTTGNVFGQVAPGTDSVVLENLQTGVKRAVNPDGNGRFLVTALPPGIYSAKSVKQSAVISSKSVEVVVGQGVEVKFDGSLATVEIVGTRPRIDVSSSNNGATFTAKELDALPIGRSVGAIIQLAPNTTRGDTRYFGAASFGGGAPSENSFYINGFPVTNPLTQLGSSELPFGSIAQAQILTGGFGAEFGRSVGGVVNITTKSGTNTWETGVSYSYSPNSMRATSKDIYYENTGDPANALTDGKLLLDRAPNTLTSSSIGAYLGGPIVNDKLFMFLAVQQDKAYSGVVSRSTASIPTGDAGKWGWADNTDTTTRYLGKFDWNLSDDHRLELTLIGDDSIRNQRLSGYDYSSKQSNGVTSFIADYRNLQGYTPVGANATILKYTGNITQDLTLSALTGTSISTHSNKFVSGAGGGSLYTVILNTPSAVAPGVTYNNPQANSGNQIPDGAEDTVRSNRLDLEYRIGDHALRAGLDDNKLASKNAGDFFPGGGNYRYYYTSSPTYKVSAPGVTQAVWANAGTLGAKGYYGRVREFTDVTDAYSDQSAQYIEDRWQVTKDLLVSLGLRNENFVNKNNLGEAFLEQKNVLSPRLGVAWDANGDSSLKLFGSLGRYAVQIPTHLAVRGAGPSTYLQQYFTYTGVAPDGSPIGVVPISSKYSPDGEVGQVKDKNVLTATNLKPNQQDEITFGFEQAVSKSLNVGAKLTYRKLLATIDDYCDDTPFYDYAAARGINTDNYSSNCVNINPGLTNTFNVDYLGTGKNYTPVTLTAKDMGFDQWPAERTYLALDLFAEHPFSNGWYGKINYTYSRNYGSTEGQTLSDIGQTDVAATQAWDFGDLMQYSYGPLPNDRTHQIKAYGYYQLNEEFTVGANLLLASGRPMNCIGAFPDPNSPAQGYGSASHYCKGLPSPRGSVGNLPWDQRLDMNVVYKPQSVKGMALKVDIFNLFNQQNIEVIDEVYQTGGYGTPVSPTYGRVISYTSPRSVKFTVQYDYKF